MPAGLLGMALLVLSPAAPELAGEFAARAPVRSDPRRPQILALVASGLSGFGIRKPTTGGREQHRDAERTVVRFRKPVYVSQEDSEIEVSELVS